MVGLVGMVGASSACSDDEASAPCPTPNDASFPDALTDAAPPATDSGVADTGPTDAGPTVSVTLGVTGDIKIGPDLLFAYFHQDDTIIRSSEEPGCVAFVRSLNKAYANALDLQVDGDFFGQDGGPAGVQTFGADPTSNAYEYFLAAGEAFYPNDVAVRVKLSKTADVVFPEIPVTTLRSSTLPLLTITEPTLPDGSPKVTFSAAKDFEVKWTVPPSVDAGAAPSERVVVTLKQFGTITKAGELFCSFPIAAGKGRVPSSLLREFRKLMVPAAGAAITGGILNISSGDQRELRIGEASYVVQTTRDDFGPAAELEP